MSIDSSSNGKLDLETQSPLLSIITVVYNSEKFIERTLRSVVSQTFRDFELVVIDGGSKDKTLDIISKYRNSIQFLVSEADEGIYDAMNKGIKASRGEYLLFLNSGDQLTDDFILEKAFASKEPYDVIYGETYLIDSNDKILGTRTQLTTRKLPIYLTWTDLRRGMVVCHQSYIVRKSIAPFYELKYKCSADIDWMIASLKKAKKIRNINAPISKYLVEGYSASNLSKCWKERFAIMCKHYGYLDTVISHFIIFLRAVFINHKK